MVSLQQNIMKVLHNNIVVTKPAPVNDRDQTSLIALLKETNKVVCSTVVAVGPGTVDDKGKEIKVEVSVGDVVFYPVECIDTSPKIKDSGEEYLVIKSQQVLCFKPKANQE